MESITDFLDPKTIQVKTGDDLDVDKELDKKSEADDGSDTVEVTINNNIEKPKVSDVTLPGKKESPISKLSSDEEEESSGESSESTESDSSESSAESDSDESGSSEKSETKKEEPAETEKKEPEKKETETADDSKKEEAVEDEDVTDPESDGEEGSPEKPVETSGDTELLVDAENNDKETETDSEKSDPADEITGDEIADDAPDSESSDSGDSEPNPEVDHGESDLDVDTQQTAPLLKLVKEYDFHSTKIYDLPNESRLIYINVPSELCMCSFDFKVGSYYEDDSNRGISHLLEHLMFNGCPGMSAVEFNKKLDKLGMTVNAFTDTELTSFHFSGLRSNFIPAFDLYASLLNSFTPVQEVLDKEREIVLNEIGVYADDGWSVLRDTINAQAYRQHPVAHPILGYENVIRNISVEQVKSWYETNYNAKNLTVYLIGDFPEEDLVFVAGKMQLFKDGIKNAAPVIPDSAVVPFYKNIITYKEGAVQTLIDSALVFKNEAFNFYEIGIMSNVLGGTMSSYLWEQFREERSIAYSVGSYMGNLDPAHLSVHLYAGLNESEDAEQSKSLFLDAFKYAKIISEEDFNKGLNIVLTGIYEMEETEGTLLNMVRQIFYFGLELDEYTNNYKNLTYDSYQTFAAGIDPDAMVTGILYPPKTN